MPTYLGKISWDQAVLPGNGGEALSSETWFSQVLFRVTKNQNSPTPESCPVWNHFYFKWTSESNGNVYRSAKLSLFGTFVGSDFAFSLNGADEDNKRLKRRIKKVLSRIIEDGALDSVRVRVVVHSQRTYRNLLVAHRTPDPKKPGIFRHAINVDLLNESSVTARVVVFHTYWLGNFIDKRDWNKLPKLVAHYTFDQFSPPPDFCDFSDSERDCIRDGDEFSVFKKRLHKDPSPSDDVQNRTMHDVRWLIGKTFRKDHVVANEPPKPPARTKFFIRISKTGVVEIREEALFVDVEMKKLLEDLLRQRPPITGGGYTMPQAQEPNRIENGEAEQDYGAINVARDFLCHFVSEFNATRGEEDRLVTTSEFVGNVQKAAIHRERQRYTVISMSRLRYGVTPVDDCNDLGYTISPFQLLQKPSMVRNILEGTLVYGLNSRSLLSPNISLDATTLLRNLSTWDNEVCMFGPERALIYFEPKTMLESDGRIVNYEDYWKTIERGIEHTISLRTAIHLLESTAQRAIEEVPNLVDAFGIYEADPTKDNKDKLQSVLNDVTKFISIILQHLPGIREVSVPASAFRATHAVDKFTHLNETCFKFPAILNHVQQDVDELTDFLQYFKQRQLNIELDRVAAERVEREGRVGHYLALMGIVLAVLAAFYTAPLFFDAFRNQDVCNPAENLEGLRKCFGSPGINFYGQVFLTAFWAVHTFGIFLYFFFAHRSKDWRGQVANVGVVISWWLLVWFMLWWFTLDGNGSPHMIEWLNQHNAGRFH